MEAREQGILRARFEGFSVPSSENLWERIKRPEKKKPLDKKAWWAIAASFSILMTASWLWMNEISGKIKTEVSDKSPVENQILAPDEERGAASLTSGKETFSNSKRLTGNLQRVNSRIVSPIGLESPKRDIRAYPTLRPDKLSLQNRIPESEVDKANSVSVKIQLVFTDPFPHEEKSGLGKRINKFNKKLKKDLDLNKVKDKAKSMFANSDKEKSQDSDPDIN